MPQLTCERCGSPLPEEARFCPRCGAPVAVAVVEERKVVSILFADLAASTELAARLDAERFREVMAAFYRLASAELASLRGLAEKFVGDAVMAVFGLPHAHEDDALRAVRAGLAIRDRTARLAAELALPLPLAVRVGINTGAVATGSGPADQLLVSGAAVNLAARLQEAAEPGEVLAGETTHQLTRDHVAFAPRRTLEARGFGEPVAAWPVASLSARSSRRTIPLVARRRELALLQDAFRRADEASRAHLVALLGPPGIGKTRLADELQASLPEKVRVLTGATSAFDDDVVLGPLADMMRRELGVERDTDEDTVRGRLDELVSGCCDAGDVRQVEARLGLALGLGTPPSAEGRSYREAEIRSGFLALLEGLGRSGPVVLRFEDLHLASPTLLDLVEDLVHRARRMRLLVLATARDHLLEQRPTWGAALTDSLRIRLEPLRFDEAKDLARTAGGGLDEATAERIALRAGGNPFFVIETTGMMLQEHPEHAAGVPHTHLLPPTVQAVIASRIDHLPPVARDLARKVSVFPRATFGLSEVALVAEAGEETLGVLEDAELLVRDEERPGVWRFRHGMLRQVAYDSLPKRERLRLHLGVAEALEREDGERANVHPVAYHLEQAARASLDLAPEDRSLADRAFAALAAAGDRARRAMESRTAADSYRRALALAGPEPGWGKAEARVLAGLGEAHYWLGEFEEAGRALEQALEVGAGDDWSETHAARFLADVELNIRGDAARAEALFERALAAAQRLDDPWATARTLLMAGWAPYWRDDLDRSRAMFEEALRVARENPRGDRWAEARALTSLASVISAVGDEAECLDLALRALGLGREMGDRFTIAVAQTYAAASLRRMWRLDEALPFEDEAIRGFQELGARWELASALGDRAAVHRFAGRLEDAEADVREALRLCREVGDRSMLGWTASELARILLARGDADGARRALEAAPPGVTEDGVSVLATEALIERVAGNPARGRELAARVVEMDRKPGQRNHTALRVWWAGWLFGEDVAGGREALEDARATLEHAHWFQALREPELWVGSA